MFVIHGYVLILKGYKGGNPNIHQRTNYRENLNEHMSYKPDNVVFGSRSKDGGKGVFSRERKLSLKNLMLLIIMFKSSKKRELDKFFKSVSQSDFNIREVTKGAFTQARAKLNSWAFQLLNEVAVNTFYQGAE